MTTTPEQAQEVVKPWEVTCKRFVAFIDIMGFKDMVMKSTHKEIYDMMKLIKEEIEFTKKQEWKGVKSNLIRSTTYSDSIMIFSKDGSQDSMLSILYSLSALTHGLLEGGIPHKGAIAFGDMTIDEKNSIYFGQPLIDSYLLQEELNFYGIIAHGTAEKHIELPKISDAFIRNYSCPFKNGNSNHLAIIPLFIFEIESDDEIIKRYREKVYYSLTKFRYSTSGHLRRYIDNTEAFFKTVNIK